MSSKQWGHGYNMGRSQGRKEATVFILGAIVTLSGVGYGYIKKSSETLRKSNLNKK